MYFYFSSTHPAVVKLNGVYFGEIFNSVKFINIDSSSCFIEICPLNSSAPQLGFFPNEEFLASPPQTISVTDMRGGYLIKYAPFHTNKGFKIIAQKKFSNSLFTIFSENGVKLSIETAYGVFADNIDFDFSSAEILPFSSDELNFIVVFYGKQIQINAYSIKEQTEKILSLPANEFNAEDFTITTLFKDMAKHVLQEKLISNNGTITKERVLLTSQKKLTVYNIHQKLVPYAMLEELLVGGKIEDFLCGSVLENSDKLPAFFGDFLGVMPPPLFRCADEVGLIYKEKENKYRVDYYLFEYNMKKISNVKKV